MHVLTCFTEGNIGDKLLHIHVTASCPPFADLLLSRVITCCGQRELLLEPLQEVAQIHDAELKVRHGIEELVIRSETHPHPLSHATARFRHQLHEPAGANGGQRARIPIALRHDQSAQEEGVQPGERSRVEALQTPDGERHLLQLSRRSARRLQQDPSPAAAQNAQRAMVVPRPVKGLSRSPLVEERRRSFARHGVKLLTRLRKQAHGPQFSAADGMGVRHAVGQ